MDRARTGGSNKFSTSARQNYVSCMWTKTIVERSTTLTCDNNDAFWRPGDDVVQRYIPGRYYVVLVDSTGDLKTRKLRVFQAECLICLRTGTVYTNFSVL